MNQNERRRYLIDALLAEREECRVIPLPTTEEGQKRLLRTLFNVRPPLPADKEFLRVQDEYLKEEIRAAGITDFCDLTPIEEGIYLWQGDITRLRCDAIVNAANSALLGCFYPNHGCIDNAIHTFAGVELRLACAALMKKQGREEKTGGAKITPAFNLPSRYVIHTVGPIVRGRLGEKERRQLAACYASCLALAEAHSVGSIAFPCISTGEFRFPGEEAAKIAVQTVRDVIPEQKCKVKVIFDVWKDEDLTLYRRFLGRYESAENRA